MTRGDAVSVIVTALNFERFLADAIGSVQAEEAPVAEILVVVAESQDGTAGLAAALASADSRIRVLPAPRHSPARSRNIGLAQAKGGIMAVMDGDDAWPRGSLGLRLDALRGTGADFVRGITGFCDHIDPATLAPPAGARIERQQTVCVGACLYRAAALAEVGPFDETMLYADDWDLQLRLRDAGLREAALPDVTLWHRRYPGSLLTTPDPRRKQELARAIARSVARRRAKGAA
ncbi:glycosyltransferase family 2 protein [Sediminicoccus sp. BL-A-41-H5]|uniref:glycosyltransferase family 2 protein n=1 Tax=Sediminicoccus sp. BL-A-41-H5 TaxID=3421106 RepID=UPI003D668852